MTENNETPARGFSQRAHFFTQGDLSVIFGFADAGNVVNPMSKQSSNAWQKVSGCV
jgi:hypothetical protein